MKPSVTSARRQCFYDTVMLISRIRRSKAEGFPVFNSPKQGFTLLEIMIALAIIGITVTVILQTVNYHAGIMYENTVTTRMYLMAKEKMYELEETQKNSGGTIEDTGFRYENMVLDSGDSRIVRLKTVIRGDHKKVTLIRLAFKKEIANP